jgi:hypothetical protein
MGMKRYSFRKSSAHARIVESSSRVDAESLLELVSQLGEVLEGVMSDQPRRRERHRGRHARSRATDEAKHDLVRLVDVLEGPLRNCLTLDRVRNCSWSQGFEENEVGDLLDCELQSLDMVRALASTAGDDHSWVSDILDVDVCEIRRVLTAIWGLLLR